ncbi:hypothetical protein GCM10022403_087590 [Streptomyces coacervatus]|uniref:ATP/GTP-binding protein n=1 Tax=Streptomyces coacervatus TaxID=647381 RepID=A0ABP7JDC8_9ACTN|nr:hypothetical protein [Streptomyces coacervatus]MDF2273504.1 hypothetical protein [Streptomyces coacervatus]
MSNADRTHNQLHPSEEESHDMITVEELLSQLDRIAPSTPGYDQAGLDRLRAWMAADDPADDVTVDEVGASTCGGPTAGKILIAGGQQAGSADFITKICEFSAPTEFVVPGQQSVTTAFFGRITLSEDLQLYNVAPPDSVDPKTWDTLRQGALGAVVLADPRRLVDCHVALNYLDDCGVPYVLALRGSSEHCPYDLAEIREALRLAGDTPVLFWEPDRRVSAASVLITVVETALERSRAESAEGDVPLDEELTALTLLTQLELLLQ